MFVWRAQTILDSLQEAAPELYDALTPLEPALDTPDQGDAIAAAYADLPKISIDFAVMEKATNVRVVEATFDWDDLGSWLALERLYPQDENGNTLVADSLVNIDTSNCVVHAESGHMMATIGVDDLVIVHTPDATLVCAKDRVDEIKQIVQKLEQGGSAQATYL